VTASNDDTAVLAAGDEDFLPTIESLQAHGLPVTHPVEADELAGGSLERQQRPNSVCLPWLSRCAVPFRTKPQLAQDILTDMIADDTMPP
jgi:hypothetical protein